MNSFLPTLSTPGLTRLCGAVQFSRLLPAVTIVTLVLFAACMNGPASADEQPLFGAPRPTDTADEILLVNTRPVGTVCTSAAMSRHLQCERYVVDEAGVPQWDVVDWRTAVTSSTALRPTFVYIHGNRVARGMDRSQGLQVYRSLAADGKPDMPIRFIIWSWPSSHIAGPVKDYKVKAHRTGPAGWQLAWFVDQLPADSPVALWGYSYGARVASGALHLLGGGTLSGLKLDERVHPDRQPLRAAMVAAAFDADWIQPGHYHGRVLAQTDMLVLATNELDPAMRFFHLSNGRGRIHALGKQGVAQPQTLGAAARRLRPIDFTREVGRTHALTEYLSASEKMTSVWRQLMGSDTSHADNIASVRRDASHRISNVEPGMSK